MAFLTVGKENSADIQINFEDRGSGKPVILIHGWPLSGAAWERQSSALLAAGFRVITYDRRGFGRSSGPSAGYDFNTMTADLAKLIDALSLDDATLVGFSMGGGEVARYMGTHGGKGVSKVAFISSIAPALGKNGTNPDGADPAIFEGLKKQIETDRYAFLSEFMNNFFNKKLVGGSGISADAVQACWNVAASSSYQAMYHCVDAWLEDFRPDVKQIKVPTLVIHGDADQIVPLEVSGARMPALIPGSKLHVVKDGPHGITWTHAAEVNKQLLQFLRG